VLLINMPLQLTENMADDLSFMVTLFVQRIPSIRNCCHINSGGNLNCRLKPSEYLNLLDKFTVVMIPSYFLFTERTDRPLRLNSQQVNILEQKQLKH
jgi:hypothetical protein